MPNIIPIKDLRNTNFLSKLVEQSNEPIFVTKSGYVEMVIMSIAKYEEQLALLEMHKSVMEGKAQADSGRLKDGKSVMAKLKAEYGL